MTKFILDASAGLQAVLKEPHSAIAIQLIADYRAGLHELLAPDIYPAEVGHALTRAERKKIIPVGDSLVHFAELMAPPPMLYPSLPLMARAVELSSALRIPTYDLIYKLLADDHGCDLVTADEKLIKSLGDPPNVIHLSKI
jgi:predicted nucleic acid-binding protein